MTLYIKVQILLISYGDKIFFSNVICRAIKQTIFSQIIQGNNYQKEGQSKLNYFCLKGPTSHSQGDFQFRWETADQKILFGRMECEHYIKMEKQQKLPADKKLLPKNINQQQNKQTQKRKIGKLGGIHLYNQDYKRHLCVNKNDPSQKENKTSTNFPSHSTKDVEDSHIQSEIKDFLEHRQQHKMNINPIFTSEVQKIIETFKYSQINTNRFLEEHQNKSDHLDNMEVFSFDQLFQAEQNKNKIKYTRLMETILQQFREIVMKEISKMRLEEANRLKEKENQKSNFATQTYNEHENQVALLKKELERKEADYNALYTYKKNMINEGENMIKSFQIKLQIQQALVTKLENQVASKNLEIRGLQRTLKQTQDRLFNKIIEIQRQSASSQARQSLSSVRQALNSFDPVKENEAIANFLTKLNSKKKRYKQRAESILSVTQSLFSSFKDKDQIVASMADIATKSMREIEIHFDKEMEESFVNELQRISRNSSDTQNLFKILEIYKKSKNRSSFDRQHKNSRAKIATNIKKTPQRNSSILEPKADKNSNRESFRQQNSFKSRALSREKPQEAKIVQKKLSRQEVAREIKQSSFISLRKPSLERGKIELPQGNIQTALSQPIKQVKPCIIKSFKEIPITTSKAVEVNTTQLEPISTNQNCKRLKKGVSFQCLDPPNLELHSHEINICISNTVKKYASQTIGSFNHISHQKHTSQYSLDVFDKHRFSKNKLTKTKLKDQVHKMTASEVQSPANTISGWNTSGNNNPVASHNATAVNLYRPSPFFNQKQRFSLHTSQEKTGPTDNPDNRSKPRNSFSRIQRPTIAMTAENEKEMKIVKQLAMKVKSRSEYHQKLLKMHRGCGQNCEHIRRYLEYFDRFRGASRKENMKLKVQDLNNNLNHLRPLPTLSKP